MNEFVLPKPQALWGLLRGQGASAILLRGTAGSCATKIFLNGAMFVSQIVFARYLGVEGFGIYVLASAWLAVLLLIGRLGFDLATVRFVAGYFGTGDWGLLKGFLVVGRISVLTGCAVVGGGLAIAAAIMEPRIGSQMTQALWLVALIMPVLAMLQVEAAAVRGLGHIVVSEIPYSVGHPVLLLGAFFVAVLWLGVAPTPSLVLTITFCTTMAALVCLWPMVRRFTPPAARREPRRYDWRHWLRTAPAMTLIAGFAVVLSQSTTIMIGLVGNAEDVGLYGAASRTAGVLQIITASLTAAIAPMAARMYAAGEIERLQRAVDLGMRAVFALNLAAAAFLAVAGKFVLGLFGPEFVAGYGAMLVLLAGQLAWAVTAPAGVLLNMTGHQNISAWILAAAAALNLLLCGALIPPFGLWGAAAATAVTMAVWNTTMAYVVGRRLSLRAHISLKPASRT